jgi:transposase
MNGLKNLKRNKMTKYSIEDIAAEFKMGISTVYERLRNLEIFPDEVIGAKRFFYEEKKNCIGCYVKYRPDERFVIFESKMNFE